MLYVDLRLATLRRALRARRDLLIENLALRQQLAVSWGCKTPSDQHGRGVGRQYSSGVILTGLGLAKQEHELTAPRCSPESLTI